MPIETQVFPYKESTDRLQRYKTFEGLLEGNHYSAFIGEVGSMFSDKYKHLRYIAVNYAGLVSKVIADLLFGEEIQIKTTNPETTKWLDALYMKNKLRTQNYESALMNSARGDAVYRIRVENKEILIEDISPSLYFPKNITKNFRAKPEVEELCWVDEVGTDRYLVKEIHDKGVVTTEIFALGKDNKIGAKIAVDNFNVIANTNYIEKADSKIGKNLIVHVPNMRMSSNFFGTSDYADLLPLFMAINNRITKTDNILDKHSDPILAVPEGVLDEEGNVKREALGMLEIGTGDTKPEYIVWNASLESAFKEIDKLIELLFMTSEISPDILGMGQGMAESGRALKYKLLRTLAKKARKVLYYQQGLKELFMICQELSIKNGYTVNGLKLTGEVIEPDVIFSDGIVNDNSETIENESTKLEAGLTSKKRAIMVIENIDEKKADEILVEIENEKPEPPSFLSNPIDNEDENTGTLVEQPKNGATGASGTK